MHVDLSHAFFHYGIDLYDDTALLQQDLLDLILH